MRICEPLIAVEMRSFDDGRVIAVDVIAVYIAADAADAALGGILPDAVSTRMRKT